MNRYAQIIRYILQLSYGQLHGEIWILLKTYTDSGTDPRKIYSKGFEEIQTPVEEYYTHNCYVIMVNMVDPEVTILKVETAPTHSDVTVTALWY